MEPVGEKSDAFSLELLAHVGAIVEGHLNVEGPPKLNAHAAARRPATGAVDDHAVAGGGSPQPIDFAYQPAGTVPAARHRCTWAGCGYVAQSSGHLQRHRQTHTGDKPFKCTWEGCTYASIQKVHLTSHMRKHNGERPFKCQQEGCEFTATRSWYIGRHMKRKHPDVVLDHAGYHGAKKAPFLVDDYRTPPGPVDQFAAPRRTPTPAPAPVAAVTPTLVPAVPATDPEQGETETCRRRVPSILMIVN